jgi:hypothetical protein
MSDTEVVVPSRREEKLLLSSKGPDLFWESSNLIFNGYCVFSPGIKLQRREADLSYYTSKKLQMSGCTFPLPHKPS